MYYTYYSDLAKDKLCPHKLRPFNITHAKNAVWDYWEWQVAKLLWAVSRNIDNAVSGTRGELGTKIKGADLWIPKTWVEIEVKMRYYSQAVYVWLSQYSTMTQRESDLLISQHYLIWFYRTKSWKRVGDVAPIGQKMDEQGIKKAQSIFKRQIQIQTLFLLPRDLIFEYFSKRDIQWTTRKYNNSVWSSNMWPIHDFFDSKQRNDKASLKLRWLSKDRPEMSLHIIWWAMIERVYEVQRNTGLILWDV